MRTANPPVLKEKKPHGSQTFRCGFYEINHGTEHFFVPPHWHDELEILYFREGHFSLEINMKHYEADGECLFFLNSGELHKIGCEEPCRESAVVFSPYLLSFLSNDDAQSRLLLPLAHGSLLLPRKISPEDSCYAAVRAEYLRLTEDYLSETGASLPPESRQLFIKSSLLRILGLLHAHNLLRKKHEPQNENVERIKTVLTYVHAHYSEKISLSDLAGLVNLNEQYFCRFFKKSLGVSPAAYVNEYRIRRAVALLTDTSLPVTDICLECGFGNFGNFLREFRRQTGTTPQKFRREKSK